ncbi:MAG: hypothetical protein L0154_25825 [Chloroflexi bacterium]|nr:hypothetical protein [Chloroflexota bacterium]
MVPIIGMMFVIVGLYLVRGLQILLRGEITRFKSDYDPAKTQWQRRREQFERGLPFIGKFESVSRDRYVRRIALLTIANASLGLFACALLAMDYAAHGDDITTVSGMGYGLLGMVFLIGTVLQMWDYRTYKYRR